jgi:hypothetical protein
MAVFGLSLQTAFGAASKFVVIAPPGRFAIKSAYAHTEKAKALVNNHKTRNISPEDFMPLYTLA